MEMEREEGMLRLRWPRSRGALFGFTLIGSLLLLIGFASFLSGQHFPHISSIATLIWACATGFPILFLGLCFLGDRQEVTITPAGVDAYFSKWRFIEWRMQYAAKYLEGISIEPQRNERSRLVLKVRGKADFEVARNLPSEDAWQMASIVAELLPLPIRGA